MRQPLGEMSSAQSGNIGRTLLILLAIYFGLHVVTRSLISNNLQLDEAEQFIVTQDWRLGYGSQPPLYNWLQKALFSAIGVNVFALSLLKNLSLWAAYAFTFLAAREILSEARLAAIATAALLFFPQLAWESQRDQSHLVLATTCAAATLWIYVRLLKTEQSLWYMLLGIAIALGFLAKYNYLLLPASLFCATFLSPQFRRALLTWKSAVTLIVCAVLIAPHIMWMLQNREAVASQSYKFLTTGLIAPKSPFAGILQVLKAFLAITIVPVLIFSPLLRSKWKSTTPLLSLLGKAFVSGLVLTLIIVAVSRVTYLRERWIQPLMFALPIFLVGIVRDAIEERHHKRLLALAVVVAITVLITINVTAIGANALKRSHNLNIPYAALAAELRKAGFDHGDIVANGFSLGGNMKNQFRNCRVIVPELEEINPPQRPTLIIWSARSENIPKDFLDYAQNLTKTNVTPSYLEIPCRNGRRTSERFGYTLVR